MLSKHSGKTGKWFPKRSLPRRILWFLSCLVVFCTTYALILPAITLANETYCHLDEHQHDENCFRSPEPLCNQESPENGTAPPHEHDESCYDENQNLICDKQEQTSVHQHADECYRSDKPLCGKEEHTHSKMCYSNQEDVEKKEDWEKTLPKKLDGTTRENLISVAESQIGYKENETNFILDSDENAKNYSRYGEWYGKPYEDWNLMFVGFVLHYSEIKDIPIHENYEEWVELLNDQKIRIYEVQNSDLREDESKSTVEDQDNGSKKPENGDLIIFDYKPKKDDPIQENLVGFFYRSDDGQIDLITGPIDGKVERLKFDSEKIAVNSLIKSESQADDSADSGDLTDQDEPADEVTPDNPDENQKDETDLDPKDEEIDIELPEEVFEGETDNFILKVKPMKTGTDSITETDASDEDDQSLDNLEETKDLSDSDIKKSDDGITSELNSESNGPNEEGSETLKVDSDPLRAEIKIEESKEELDKEDLTKYYLKFDFYLGDQKVNTDDYQFDLEVQPKDNMINQYLNLQKAQDTEETEVELSLYDSDVVEEINLVDSTVLADQDEVVMRAQINSNEATVTGRKLPNPSFTVQTYGLIPIPDVGGDSSGKTIPVYDQTITSDHADPFSSDNKKNIGLKITGSPNADSKEARATIRTTEKLTQIYENKSYKYHSHPNLNYFDLLKNNTSYKLIEIWKLKEGKSATSIDKDNDFDVYSSSSVKFTNRIETIENNTDSSIKYILIKDQDVIRLVYKPIANQDSLSVSAKFFDYDISEKNCTDHDKQLPITRTSNSLKGGQGINNINNFSDKNSSTLFTVGNKNTGYESDGDLLTSSMFNGKYLNKGQDDNTGKDKPLVTGIVENNLVAGNLKFNDGISHPKLFDDGDATGKNEINGGQLIFNRSGDTYTLSQVSGSNLYAQNLHELNHPSYTDGTTHKIWTNNFWPLDNIEGADPKYGIGSWSSYNPQNRQEYHLGNDGSKKKNGYPRSDDDINHNCLFGMRTDIKFKTDTTYTGPMNYFFFGDDDLWVFIDGKKIADIGGVKSSTGVYVDITKMNLAEGDHTLTIFYMERGNSGSTCYMQFNLPSVSGIETGQSTGGFQLHKVTEDLDENTSFSFQVEFMDKSGNPLLDDYSYEKYDSKGDLINPSEDEDRLIIASNDIITLKKDQYIKVGYLPIGTVFKITEMDIGDKNKVSFSNTNSDYTESSTHSYQGEIRAAGNTVPVYCQNIRFFKLPETGGIGSEKLMQTGAMLLAAASLIGLRSYYKKRRRSP